MEKKRRLALLKEVVQSSCLTESQKLLGETLDVLLEGPAKRPGYLRGRLRNGRMCHVRCGKQLEGLLVKVKVTKAFSRWSKCMAI